MSGRLLIILAAFGGLVGCMAIFSHPILGIAWIAFTSSSNVSVYLPHTTTPILMLTLFALFIKRIFSGDTALRIPGFFLWMLLLFAWEIASIVWAPGYDHALPGVLLRNIALVCAFLWVIQTPKQFYIVMIAAFLGVMVSSIQTVQSMYDFFTTGAIENVASSSRNFAITRLRFSGTWDDPNILGLSMLPFVLLAFVLLRSKVFPAVRIASFLCIIFGSIAIALSLSRGALLFYIVGFSLFLWGEKKRLLVFSVLFLLLLIVTAIIPSDVFSRVGTLFSGTKDSSVLARSQLAIGSLNMAIEHLPFGVGLGNVITYSADYNPTLIQGIVAHNAFIDILAETGIIGIFLLFAVFASIIREVIPKRWRIDPSNVNQNLTIGFAVLYICIIGTFLIGSYLNYSLFWIMMALMCIRNDVFSAPKEVHI